MRHLYTRGPALPPESCRSCSPCSALPQPPRKTAPPRPRTRRTSIRIMSCRETPSRRRCTTDGRQFALDCARCHGDWGVGTSFAPALVESVKPGGTIPTQELFIQTVCAGRADKGMPAWCALGLDISKMQTMHAYLVERASGRMGPGRPAVRE